MTSTEPAPGAPEQPSFLSQAGWRARMRRTPGGGHLLQVLVFLLGLLFILLGLTLAALPGPLTIPPVLVGLYIWSTEFVWADRLLERAKKSAQEAWSKAKEKPVISSLVTVAGLVALGVGIYLVGRFDLVARGRELIGF